MSRTNNLIKNVKWSYIGTFSLVIVGFIVKTLFVKSLGNTINGVNSIYASIIGVLSIAELGIGSILNTQLYGPVAEKDENTIIAITQLYKKVYRVIALFIFIAGLLVIPFLDIFLKGTEGIRFVKYYYLFFLFNTVISYFATYKFSISNAEQKNYIEINFETVFTLIMYAFQLVALVVFKSFFGYLIVQSVVTLAKAIFISSYMNKRYPFLQYKKKVKLSKEKSDEIKKNIFAGMVNKFSDVAINQTDNMLISAFVNVNSLGYVSNYAVLRTYLEKFTKPLLDNTGSTVGNYVNTEQQDRKLLLIKTLQLYSLMIYGYISLILLFLSTPFIRLWFGDEFVIPFFTIFVMSLNLMLSGVGDRPYVIFKNAHGNFYNDWFVVLSSAIINLVVSIVLGSRFGIVGIFLGTSFTIITSVIWRPFIFYKTATGEKVCNYFGRLIKNYSVTLIVGFLVWLVDRSFNYPNIFIEMIVKVLLITILFYGVVFILFLRTDEMNYMKNLLSSVIKQKLKRE